MDPTSSNLAIFFTGLSTVYQDGYTNTAAWYDQVAMEVPSDTELETYGWMDKIPAARQWIGPRLVNSLPTLNRSVTNLDFEITDSIPRNKFEDDKYGIFKFNAVTMGEQMKKLHDQQLAAIMQSTATTQTGPAVSGNPVCFDGTAFFGTSHPVDVSAGASGPLGTYSNDLTTTSLTPTNYGAVRAQMRGFIGRDGKPIGAVPSLLVVPPQLEEAAKVICESAYIAPALFGDTGSGGQVGTTENVWKGTAKYLVVEELANQPKVWYALDQRRAVKPFLVQIRKAPQFVYLVNPTDPNVFFNKEFVFGADSRSAYDVTLPWLAVRGGIGL